MADLRDYEWRLSYPGTDFVFGHPTGPIFNLIAPDIGDAELRVDDAERPRDDGRGFGQDFRSGLTIAFELATLTFTEADARDLAAAARRAWRADAIRRTPGVVAELTGRHAGRERSTFGRPRRFAAADQFVAQGHIAMVATFATVDDLWYGSIENSMSVSIAQPVGGGLEAPLASPLTSTSESDRSLGITVGGELPAWPVITVHGPITNPAVELVGLWKLELLTTLAFDRTVTIDTRPWARTVQLNGGGNLAGALSRSSPRLGNASIPPGTYEVVLRGVDATGTASMDISWRETYPTH